MRYFLLPVLNLSTFNFIRYPQALVLWEKEGENISILSPQPCSTFFTPLSYPCLPTFYVNEKGPNVISEKLLTKVSWNWQQFTGTEKVVYSVLNNLQHRFLKMYIVRLVYCELFELLVFLLLQYCLERKEMLWFLHNLTFTFGHQSPVPMTYYPVFLFPWQSTNSFIPFPYHWLIFLPTYRHKSAPMCISSLSSPKIWFFF